MGFSVFKEKTFTSACHICIICTVYVYSPLKVEIQWNTVPQYRCIDRQSNNASFIPHLQLLCSRNCGITYRISKLWYIAVICIHCDIHSLHFSFSGKSNLCKIKTDHTRKPAITNGLHIRWCTRSTWSWTTLKYFKCDETLKQVIIIIIIFFFF